MSMTLEELRDEVYAITLRPSTDPVITEERVDRVINQAIREACSLHTFHCMRQEHDLEIGTGAYYKDLPEGTVGVKEVRVLITSEVATDLTGYKLCIRDKKWAVRRYINLDAIAGRKPEVCWIDREQGRLYIAPKTDQEYTLRSTLIVMPSDLVNEADEQPIDFGDNMIIARAVSKIFKMTQQFEESAQWEREFLHAFRACKNADVTMHGTIRSPDRDGSGETSRGYDPNNPFEKYNL